MTFFLCHAPERSKNFVISRTNEVVLLHSISLKTYQTRRFQPKKRRFDYKKGKIFSFFIIKKEDFNVKRRIYEEQ